MARILATLVVLSLALYYFQDSRRKHLNQKSIERGVNAVRGTSQARKVPFRPRQPSTGQRGEMR